MIVGILIMVVGIVGIKSGLYGEEPQISFLALS